MRPRPTVLPAILALSTVAAALPARVEAQGDPLHGAQALADDGYFDEAALRFEDRARALFGTGDAARALAAATILRLGLGHLEQARADAARLDQIYGEGHAAITARVTLARARRHAGLLEWEPLRALLVEALPALDRRAPRDVRLEAHALLGRALERLGKHEDARAEHRWVLALAKPDPAPGLGADAVGEARFFFAEEAGAAAARVVLAPYDGRGDRASVIAYLRGPAARWMERKAAALETAERAYLRVLGVIVPPPSPPLPPPLSQQGLLSSAGIDPNAPLAPWGSTEEPLDGRVPSPRWAVAAAARVALGWGDFADAFRRLPMPREWSSPPPVMGEYFLYAYEDTTWGPRHRAKRACETCLRIAEENGIADVYTDACEAWLSRHFPVEHRAVDELRPRVATPPALVFAPARRDP
jgi:hypothetical protein